MSHRLAITQSMVDRFYNCKEQLPKSKQQIIRFINEYVEGND